MPIAEAKNHKRARLRSASDDPPSAAGGGAVINIDALCAELNEALPKAGWPMRYPLHLHTYPKSGSRCAAAIWGGAGDGECTADGPEIGLQLCDRDKKPIVIVFETKHSCGVAEPERQDAAGIIAALNEFRWVIAPQE